MNTSKQLIVAIENELKTGFFLTLQEKCKIDYQKICDVWNKYFEIQSESKIFDKSKISDDEENGYLDYLKYIHKNGCEWTSECTEAAKSGYLECLKYAHENGCPWDEYTCTAAAENGHLDCLKYAYENGCEWSKETSYKASTIKCFQYIEKNWIYPKNTIEKKFICDEYDEFE